MLNLNSSIWQSYFSCGAIFQLVPWRYSSNQKVISPHGEPCTLYTHFSPSNLIHVFMHTDASNVVVAVFQYFRIYEILRKGCKNKLFEEGDRFKYNVSKQQPRSPNRQLFCLTPNLPVLHSFESYQSNRLQFVHVTRKSSSHINVNYGNPCV